MSDIVIKAENISKLYRLGTIGNGSLRQDMQLWWQNRILKKDNPFFGITKESESKKNNYLWALKGVDFEIKEGESLGIIGHNGAGKSTLLKILSRIIKPTEGSVKGKGKISSLLEVGTGFHHELTGRENIFISGYMLGMKKQEILKKFDEIVDFSGIERFLDTPVKRYSSGMYVRLAFAVAAHLEPDILIVDEVLAVGDAEFQKKCMGKMRDVSTTSGRTIIFVSHNMQAINALCTKAIWLQKGSITATGDTKIVVNQYLGASQRKIWKQEWKLLDEAPGNNTIKMLYVELIPLPQPSATINIQTPITVRFRFYNFCKNQPLVSELVLFTLSGECVFVVSHEAGIYDEGLVEGECTIPGNFLNDGSYYFSIAVFNDARNVLFYFEECLHFDVEDYTENADWYLKWWGYVRPQFPFRLTQAKKI